MSTLSSSAAQTPSTEPSAEVQAQRTKVSDLQEKAYQADPKLRTADTRLAEVVADIKAFNIRNSKTITEYKEKVAPDPDQLKSYTTLVELGRRMAEADMVQDAANREFLRDYALGTRPELDKLLEAAKGSGLNLDPTKKNDPAAQWDMSEQYLKAQQASFANEAARVAKASKLSNDLIQHAQDVGTRRLHFEVFAAYIKRHTPTDLAAAKAKLYQLESGAKSRRRPDAER